MAAQNAGKSRFGELKNAAQALSMQSLQLHPARPQPGFFLPALPAVTPIRTRLSINKSHLMRRVFVAFFVDPQSLP
jgi:hypothetical protein